MNEKDKKDIIEETEQVSEEELENTESTGEAEAEAEAEAVSSDKKKTDKKAKARIGALEKEVQALKAQCEELNDKYLRVSAEYQNFRTRSQKEKEGIYADALADSVKELLPLLDNLERAAAFTEADKVAEGLGLILKTVPEVLSKMKVETFGEKGEQFDPNVHNAVMHEENGDYGENEITDVFQKGYRSGDKIIRYAMVKVAN